jgi:predicted nucleotidyltransferase
VYDDVLAGLSDCDIRFVVTGGHAVRFHGYDRPVEDLDIVVDRNPAAATQAMNCLMRFGFIPTIPLHLSQVVVLTFGDSRGRRVDVNAIYQPPFQQLLERAVAHDVLGRRVAFISLADLLEVKRVRGRAYDLEDVRQLLRLHDVEQS